MSGKSTLENFKAMLGEARLPERTVPICLRGDLAADHEQLERQLAQAEKTGATSLEGSGAGDLADRILAVEADMREHTYEFRLRALPRARWRALVAEHPPRKDDDGGVVDADRIGVNADTFYDAIVRACLVDPELTDGEWETLTGALTDRQCDDLAEAAWDLNRRDVDIPFSRAASRMRRTTAGG